METSDVAVVVTKLMGGASHPNLKANALIYRSNCDTMFKLLIEIVLPPVET